MPISSGRVSTCVSGDTLSRYSTSRYGPAMPAPSRRPTITSGFCAGPVLRNASRCAMSSADARRNNGVLARIRSRSRKASRIQAMSAGDGLAFALRNTGRSNTQSLPLSRCGGSPAPKPLSVPLQSRRLNQSPESKLLRSSDLLRSRSMPAWKYATPWLKATNAAPSNCTLARSSEVVPCGSFNAWMSHNVGLSWFST